MALVKVGVNKDTARLLEAFLELRALLTQVDKAFIRTHYVPGIVLRTL